MISRFFSEDPIHLYIRRISAPEVLFTRTSVRRQTPLDDP